MSPERDVAITPTRHHMCALRMDVQSTDDLAFMGSDIVQLLARDVFPHDHSAVLARRDDDLLGCIEERRHSVGVVDVARVLLQETSIGIVEQSDGRVQCRDEHRLTVPCLVYGRD